MEGFLDMVANAWTCLPSVDVCRALDHKLRSVAKALKGWSMQRIGSIRFQLAVARVVIFELDVTQETRVLSPEELELRKDLKAATLGLASLSRTIARQRSRYRYLKDGDANTKFSTSKPATASAKATFRRSCMRVTPSLRRKVSRR